MNQAPKIESPYFKYGIYLTLFLGIFIRVWVYVENRSLFLDEVNICRNVIEKSFSDFFSPLDYFQFAPPLWISMVKVCSLIFGNNEYALRLFPLFIGIGTLFLFYFLSKKIITQKIPLLFVNFVFAFNMILIRYASEVKQYGTDAFLSLLLILLALRIQSGKLKNKDVLFWVVIGSLSIWMSMPSVFLLGGIGAFMLLKANIFQNLRSNKKEFFASILPIGIIGISWLINFGIYFKIILSKGASATEQLSYHKNHFLPIIPTSTEAVEIWLSIHFELLRNTIGVTAIAITAGLFFLILGWFYAFKRNKGEALLLFIPLLLCWIASSLGKYPLWPRLALFYIPVSILVIGMGVDFIWKKINYKYLKWAMGILLLVLASQQWGYKYFYKPLETDEIKPVLKYISEHSSKEDLIFVNRGAVSLFLFYTDLHDDKYHEYPLYENPVFLNKWNENKTPPDLTKYKRFWYLNGHIPQEEIKPIIKQFKSEHNLLKEFHATNAACYLFEKK